MRALHRQHVETVAVRPDVHQYYFLDETGLRLDYTRHYTRARDSRRVGGALDVRGLTAVQVLDGALN